MITSEILNTTDYAVIEDRINDIVLDFYTSSSSRLMVREMMHLHECFINATNVAAFGRDDEEIRDCAEAIIDLCDERFDA